MAVTALDIVYTDLRRAIAVERGLDRTPGNWDSDTTADIEAFLEEGLRNVYFPIDPQTGRIHRWSFLYPHKTLTTTAPYSTGTITIASGVVTGDGTVFPSDWSAQGEVEADSNVYDVDTYTNGTTITLIDTSVDVSAGTSYTLRRTKYDLPDDFGCLDGPITFGPQDPWSGEQLPIVDEGFIRNMRHGVVATSWPPRWAAVIPKEFTSSTGQRWQLYMWPPADDAYIIWYRYQRNPYNLDATDDFPYGGPPHANTFLYSCLAAVEVGLNDEPGVYWQKFQTALMASIQFDKQAATPDFFPHMPVQSNRSTFVHREGVAYGSITNAL